MAILSSLRAHLAQLITKDPPDGAVGAIGAIGRRRTLPPRQSIRPSVRMLEPRLVLNASAELTSLGQLVITGTDAADYVRLDVNSTGQITLQNEFGARIDIVGNPNGQAEPLNPEAIFSNEIQFNLLGGNDTLDLTIPSGLNVSVVDGDGNDNIQVIRFDSPQPNESATHQLIAQSIRFNDSLQPLDWRSQNFQLTGDVYVGSSLSTSPTEILIDGGSWEVSGRLILQSDVDFLSNTLGGSVDLFDATLTADEPSTTLTFDLGHTDAAFLKLGNIDNSGTEHIENLTVKSASTVEMQSPAFNLPGELSIQNVSIAVTIDSQISASSISIQASTIQFMDASLTTDSGNIYIDGPVGLLGDLDVKTASGDVTFTSTIDGNHELVVDAGTGVLTFQNDVGGIQALSGIHLTGSAISVHSLVTLESDITLVASEIELFGDQITTILSGDILFDGPVTVNGLSSEVRSSGSVQFDSTIQGKLGTESLVVTAASSIDLKDPVSQLGSLSLQAFGDIRLMGTIEVNQDFLAMANRLTVSQNIKTDPISDGSVTLIGLTEIITSPTIEIAIGTGQLTTQGPITILGDLTINAQAGNIQLASMIDGVGVLNLSNPGGSSVIQDAIGSRQPLAGVNLQSGQLSVNTIVVQDNSIVLTADEIDFTGQTISTLDSGNILINGDLTTTTSGNITSADSVQINGVIRGVFGTEDVTITANDRIDLTGGAQQIGSLSLQANNTVQTFGRISVNQDLTAKSDTVIISGDIVLLSDSAGVIALDGTNRVQIDNDSTVSVGNGTLSIQTEGVVDTVNATITSNSPTAAVQVRGASIIMLGNIDLGNGLVDLQTVPLSTATITQATGTSITASRLRISAGGDVLLLNPNNDFQFFEDLNIRGDLRVRDNVGDLTIASTLVLGTTVDISTAGTLYLLDNAITASQADLNLQAGMSIINSAVNLTQYNIASKTLIMTAVTGIGSSAPIQLQSIQSLDVTTVDGGIELQQQTFTDTTLTRLAAQTGLVKFEQFGLSEIFIQSISSGRDGVSIVNHAGSVDLAVSPFGGNTITGGEFGRIAVEADGFIRMPDGSRIDADRGTIFLASVDDTTIGGLKTTGTQANAIEVSSLAGSIIDNGDQDIDIDANNGGVILTAFSGIGHPNQLETAIDRLSAKVLMTGSINIVEQDSINLINLSTDDGLIEVIADGTITATSVVSVNRNITLQARGSASDILVGQITANNSADVLLVAGDDVLGIGNAISVEVIADDLEIIAGNATEDGNVAVALSTDINDLLLIVNGTARGDAEIRELNSLSLASSDLRSDTHQLRTTNGEIRIIAGDSILLLDLDQQNDQTTPLADPEIIAGGFNGRIVLIAKNTIELGNQTQIVAVQSTPGAMRFESGSIIFGETIEINTGSGVAIAKFFLPRPAAGEMETAFYDATTVSTDTLTQENAKDAKGFLTVKVGLPGERGLQVDIDWGAPSNRFQTITNISADNSRLVDGAIDINGPITDDALLRVSHVYLESDVLSSVLNGRTSATGPLNVRFSVSHHESIIIQANNVTQGFDESAAPLSVDIVGRLVSSTDNPVTVGVFESGTARFIVPNLSIPVAFFPVREIIPESVKPELLSRPLDSVLLSTGSLESESGSASSLVIRDEFFQIRILSPDPFGEDLAEPKRLPDDILSGDKLQRLFKNLPDGRYEIGYVFGDGNVRSLLMIDNRDGVTKVLGQEIEGGPLRLERLAPSEIEVQQTPHDLPGTVIPVEEIPKPSEAEPDKELSGDTKEAPKLEDQGLSPTLDSFEFLTSVVIVGGFLIDHMVDSLPKTKEAQSTAIRRLKHASRTDTPINRFSLVGRFLSRQQRQRSNNDSD